MTKSSIEQTVELYIDEKHMFQEFLDSVRRFFELDPVLNDSEFPVIHSMKSRLKDPTHLKEKLKRKLKEGRVIDSSNLYQEITDLAGLRILHLHMDQFELIHKKLMSKIENEDWALVETPKAYTWDPEIVNLLKSFEVECHTKESFYTSVHYLVKPNNKRSKVICEIQVRTLFEEIWGEIDHSINYPTPTESVACREQLRVLARLVSTGTRLTGAILNSHREFDKITT